MLTRDLSFILLWENQILTVVASDQKMVVWLLLEGFDEKFSLEDVFVFIDLHLKWE